MVLAALDQAVAALQRCDDQKFASGEFECVSDLYESQYGDVVVATLHAPNIGAIYTSL